MSGVIISENYFIIAAMCKPIKYSDGQRSRVITLTNTNCVTLSSYTRHANLFSERSILYYLFTMHPSRLFTVNICGSANDILIVKSLNISRYVCGHVISGYVTRHVLDCVTKYISAHVTRQVSYHVTRHVSAHVTMHYLAM